MSQPSNDPMAEYLRLLADFIRAQEEGDGSAESQARIETIADELDFLWYSMTPSQVASVNARLASKARAVFIPSAQNS